MSGKWAIPAIITSIILLSGTFGFVLSNSASAAPPTLVTICHMELNPPNFQTITIGPVAALAHLGLHTGDTYGSCGGDQMCKSDCLATAKFQRQCISGDIKCAALQLADAVECAAGCS